MYLIQLFLTSETKYICHLYSPKLYHRLLKKLRLAIGITVPIVKPQVGGA